MNIEEMNDIEIKNIDGFEYLLTIPNNSVDLILTDPPYIISKETGMNLHYNNVKSNKEKKIEFLKTEEEWNQYKKKYELDHPDKIQEEIQSVQEETPVVQEETPSVQEETPSVQEEHPAVQEETPSVQEETPAVQEETPSVQEENPSVQEETPSVQEENQSVKLTQCKIQLNEEHKMNYMKYGTIYGKKYCVKTVYGDWDNNFTLEILDNFIEEYYNKLKNGGTIIIFFDLWKISYLKEIMEKYKFKQIRFIEWIKTNPQPLNSNVNYLTNCREIALLGVKGSKPTFHSKYDKGIYEFPLQGGKDRFHPTQKSLPLFEELIKKHSNENDIVLDTFLGGGTTAIACKKTKRKFKGCEISTEYYHKLIQVINKIN